MCKYSVFLATVGTDKKLPHGYSNRYFYWWKLIDPYTFDLTNLSGPINIFVYKLVDTEQGLKVNLVPLLKSIFQLNLKLMFYSPR